MAFPSLGPFKGPIDNFKNSLNQIFGGADSKGTRKLGAVRDIVKPDGDLKADTSSFDPTHWTGNTNRTGIRRFRYGFRIVDPNSFGIGAAFGSAAEGTTIANSAYYLDIPPQAISQKEIFATNITATRRGVVVESEGVVFKDIVISGTTGVFPGPRDQFAGNRVNLKALTSPPSKAGGVREDGTSSSSEVVSGYAEFLGLRAFFLKYAQIKIAASASGDPATFLVFVNEKDQQALVVEPLEFVMERNSKNPLQYQYRIVLKCITTLDALFVDIGKEGDPGGIINDIVNVSRNATAAIQQFRDAVGASNQLVQSISQEIDKTFINPLRLLGTALKDVGDGLDNILKVHAALKKSLNDAELTIKENLTKLTHNKLVDLIVDKFSSTFTTFKTGSSARQPSSDVSTGKISERGTTDFLTSDNLLSRSKAESYVNNVVTLLDNSAKEPLPRSFVLAMKQKAQELADDISDVVNLGNADYNTIKNRTATFLPNPLRTATSSEYLLLGSTLKLIAALDQVLATNTLFLPEAAANFGSSQEALKNIVNISAPNTVKEITILNNDTLEKIALRNYGSVTHWVELVVLNKLKYPYISATRSDGVKAYGDKLLVGN